MANYENIIIRISRLLDPKYIYWYLWSKKGQYLILENFKGAAQGGINRSFAQNTIIVLAPIKEQNQISASIDKSINKVLNIQTHLEKFPKFVSNFRQQVLHQAVTGQLTKDWRKKNKISKHWTEFKLIDVIKDKPRNGLSKKAVDFKTNVKTLILSATTSGRFNDKFTKYIDVKIPKNSHLWLKKNDILIQRSNSLDYVGVSAIYEGRDNEFIYPDLMMKVQANEKVMPKYLSFVLADEKIRNYFRDNATGTAGNMPKINQATVAAAPLILPPKIEQKEIVKRVEFLFKQIDKVEQKYKSVKEIVDQLPQLILTLAYSGKLVPQNPKDEPASELLARIKMEKQNAG
jgi:type I restriction enzyme, S subunit